MVLVQKWPFSQLFFLGTISQENVFYDILERKNPFLGYKNKKFKKLKNWDFSRGVNPWFWFKNGHFSNFFFTQYKPGKCFLWYCRTKKRLSRPVSYTHLRAHETDSYLVCRLLLEKKIWKNGDFLAQNHGITPLEKCQVFDFLNFMFL